MVGQLYAACLDAESALLVQPLEQLHNFSYGNRPVVLGNEQFEGWLAILQPADLLPGELQFGVGWEPDIGGLCQVLLPKLGPGQVQILFFVAHCNVPPGSSL